MSEKETIRQSEYVLEMTSEVMIYSDTIPGDGYIRVVKEENFWVPEWLFVLYFDLTNKERTRYE